ncbi:MAG: TetR/AcrR family transcriptional regulator [Rubrivivax sp.]|nr:TetR/AcrR family transcriptional regulator [Rubrivivax sp.]
MPEATHHGAPETARRRRKEARPHELIDAALSLFVEKGFAGARSEEVAARAGVSKGTLYLYFPSKEDLFKAVIRTHLTAPIAEGQALADQFQGASAELLSTLVMMLWHHVGHTPAGSICKVVMAEARNFPEIAQFYVNEVIEPTHRLLSGALRRGIARGEFRPVAVDHAVPALIAPSLLLAMHKHSVGACPICLELPMDDDAAIRTQIEIVLGGLCVTPPVSADRAAPAGAACAEPRTASPSPP